MRLLANTAPGRRLPLRLLLCLFLLANPLLGMAGGGHLLNDQEAGATTSVPPCHGSAEAVSAVGERATPHCPHCSGEAPAAACQCCDFGAASVPPLVPATPTRLENGPVTVLGRLPDTVPLSPRERLYRPPIESV